MIDLVGLDVDRHVRIVASAAADAAAADCLTMTTDVDVAASVLATAAAELSKIHTFSESLNLRDRPSVQDLTEALDRISSSLAENARTRYGRSVFPSTHPPISQVQA